MTKRQWRKCDRCGETVKEDDAMEIEIRKNLSPKAFERVLTEEYDLCPSCYRRIKDFLNEKIK